MKLRFIQLRDALADSFWFVPLAMALLAGGVALGTVAIDHAIGSGWVQHIGWVWSGGPDGARGVLSVVAGSVMTVVSIVFSLTVTTLAQTSSHYGPRVLRNFTSDRFVQFTLGTFVSTFVYCLLVMRTVRSVEESSFVPYLAVNLGVFLALASLAVLIFFIHHVAQSIQAETLIADIGEDLQNALPLLFPERIGQPQGAPHTSPHSPDEGTPTPPWLDASHWPDESRWRHAHPIDSPTAGYLQRVDDEQLMRLATQHNLMLQLEKRPGDFVAGDVPLMRVLPAAAVNDAVAHSLRSCYSLGRHRTPHQDALYIVQQLVEVAAHALSPGINEPFTAFTCIDWLGAALRTLAQREMPDPLRQDENGHLRVMASALGFDAIAHAIFDPIRQYGASNPDVLLRLLTVISNTAPVLHRESDREVLRRHASLIGEDAAQIYNENDRRRVTARVAETLHALTQSDMYSKNQHSNDLPSNGTP